MVKCELCGREVKTTQALKGHKTWVHGITGNTRQPAAQLVTEQVDRQLKEPADQLEPIRAARASGGEHEAGLDAISRKLDLYRSEWKEAHDRLAAVLNRNGDAAKQQHGELKSQLEKVETQQRVHTHDDLGMIPQLIGRVTKQEQDIVELKNGLARAKKLAIRIPTDDTESLKLDDGLCHTFRIYNSMRGLTQPYLVANDLIFGRKYVDLAEPED